MSEQDINRHHHHHHHHHHHKKKRTLRRFLRKAFNVVKILAAIALVVMIMLAIIQIAS